MARRRSVPRLSSLNSATSLGGRILESHINWQIKDAVVNIYTKATCTELSVVSTHALSLKIPSAAPNQGFVAGRQGSTGLHPGPGRRTHPEEISIAINQRCTWYVCSFCINIYCFPGLVFGELHGLTPELSVESTRMFYFEK